MWTRTSPNRPGRASRAAAVALSVAGVVAAASAGCGGDGLSSGPITVPPKARVGVVKPADVVDPASGLKAGDRWTLHHASIGSELLPLAFLIALDDPKTGKAFMTDPERFGLLALPEPSERSPVMFPVGLSVAPSRDLRFANVQMAGVNCAACHVGEVVAATDGRPRLVIEGAPNAFDAAAFYRDLAASADAAAATPSAAWAFLGRVYAMYRYSPMPPTAPPAGGGGGGGAANKKGAGKGQAGGKAFAKKKGGAGKGAAKAKTAPLVPPKSEPRLTYFGWASNPQEVALIGPPPTTFKGAGVVSGLAGLPVLYPDLAALKAVGPAERAAAEALERLHREELARPPLDLEAGLVVAPPAGGSGPLADYLAALDARDASALSKFGAPLTDASAALRHAWLGDPPVSKAEAETREATAPATDKPPSAVDAAGPAAVDDLLRDFAETVRLLRASAAFLGRLARATAGPDSNGPGPGRVDAFGALRARLSPADPARGPAPVRVPPLWGFATPGQGPGDVAAHVLGTGGVALKADGASTLNGPDVGRLATIAVGIRRPAWPERLFGTIDAEKAARGAVLYGARCAACHDPAPDGTPRPSTVEQVGTDPNRAREFPVAEREAPKGGKERPKAARPGPVEAHYLGRDLTAVWATAPYLHNGSVPTLHDLLLPEDQRPKTFPVGRRVYDPKRLGVSTDEGSEARWTFDVTKPGNSNKGHSGPAFGTDLSEDDRGALLEFLKTDHAGRPRSSGGQ